MANELKLAFIGGGTMAEAILSGVLDKGLAAPDAICVGEPVSGRRDYLSEMYGVNTTSDNIHAVGNSRYGRSCGEATAAAGRVGRTARSPRQIPGRAVHCRRSFHQEHIKGAGSRGRYTGNAQHAGPGGGGDERLDRIAGGSPPATRRRPGRY